MRGYSIELESFSGPLDLLLFFIRRDEINIMDIPIARITEEYLSYIETVQALDIAIAEEFVMMAATLMRIKVRMLLPQFSLEDEEEEPVDPRAELAQRLLEYQRYREAAVTLTEMLVSENRRFPRPVTTEYSDLPDDPSLYLEEVSLFELATIFKRLLERMPAPVTYDLERDKIKVRDKMAFLMSQFVLKKRYMFSELFSDPFSRKDLIATFMAILELVKEGKVWVLQKHHFDDFVLEIVSPGAEGQRMAPPVGEA
ncbi:MAG: segregation/condensation protein A [Candidatus Neomarinimicrobiota bacterium]